MWFILVYFIFNGFIIFIRLICMCLYVYVPWPICGGQLGGLCSAVGSGDSIQSLLGLLESALTAELSVSQAALF